MLVNVDICENLYSSSTIALLIDHTLLKPEATESDVVRLCSEAAEHSFASVCVNPCWVRAAVETLKGSTVKVCTVVGFPLGVNETRTKLYEAELALEQGAKELDMVQNVGALRMGATQAVRGEIEQLARIAHAGRALLKVILETCLLNEEQKRESCRIAIEAQADFVKTSTGFSTGGATADDVRLMRRSVGETMGVKASGGIRSSKRLQEMVEAGATRIGTSSGLQIIRELEDSSAAEN